MRNLWPEASGVYPPHDGDLHALHLQLLTFVIHTCTYTTCVSHVETKAKVKLGEKKSKPSNDSQPDRQKGQMSKMSLAVSYGDVIKCILLDSVLIVLY